MEFKDIVINSVIIGLVTICLLYFAIGFINLNGGDSSQLNTPMFNFTGLNQSLSYLQTQSEAQQNQLTEENALQSPLLTFGSIVFQSIIGTAKTLFILPITIAKFILGGISNVFGVPPIVMGVILSLLITLSILAYFSLMRLGR